MDVVCFLVAVGLSVGIILVAMRFLLAPKDDGPLGILQNLEDAVTRHSAKIDELEERIALLKRGGGHDERD